MDKAQKHQLMANAIRFLSADMVERAKSGHPGIAMGMADVVAVLFDLFLKYDPSNPLWESRDRLVLSAGHGSAMLYAALHLAGYDVTIEDLKNFRQLDSKTPGHPEYNLNIGIETTTGPLGHGLGNAVGMAMAARKAQTYSKVYCISSDGCLMEGISHEAAALAGHLNLSNLVLIYDNNQISIDGPTSLSDSTDSILRFRSYGWHTIEVDGHNYDKIEKALVDAQNSQKPTLLSCKTIIGFGCLKKQGSADSHGAPLGPEELQFARKSLSWPYKPFEITDEIYSLWRKNQVSAHCTSPENININQIFTEIRKNLLVNQAEEESTRKNSGEVARLLAEKIPQIIGGSADLSESNQVKNSFSKQITKKNVSGNYIHYGIREHAMGAIMNGLALGGYIPYGGTFLVFSDFMRPSIRLAALMGLRVIFVCTHDSIAVGEDGPTHQPIEQLASLRIMPNLCVIRPATLSEVIDAWEIALLRTSGPTLIALTRQKITQHTESKSKLGGYVVSVGDGMINIIASGSEVAIAFAVKQLLLIKGINPQIISMPCIELFKRQNAEYQNEILQCDLRVVIEAGVRESWDFMLRSGDIFCGLDSFGKSAPYQKLHEYFGLTPELIVKKILDQIR